MLDLLLGRREGVYLKMVISFVLLILLFTIIGLAFYFGVSKKPEVLCLIIAVSIPLNLRLYKLVDPKNDYQDSREISKD